MIVAIPMDAANKVYHDNPITAIQFALYEIDGERHDIRYRSIGHKLNPWETWKESKCSDPKMKKCCCDQKNQTNPHHISEHYALLQVVGKCDFLIVNRYCLNTLNAFKNVGIKIYKVPPFVKTVVDALDHFIIGANLADNLQNIHPAS